MVELTREYCKVAKELKKMLGYGVPLFVIPQVETTEGLIKNIRKCIKEKNDTLLEIYQVEISDNILIA